MKPSGKGDDDDDARSSGDEKSSSSSDSSDSEAVRSEQPDVMSAADSEMEEEAEEGLAALADGGEDMGVGGGDENEDDDGETEERVERAAPYTYTEQSADGYVSYTRHTEYKDVKVRVLPRWHKYLTGPGFSRAVTIAHYDMVKEKPERSRLMLRAWVVFRLGDESFLELNAARRAWREAEKSSVLYAFKRSGFPQCGGLGSERALPLLTEWLPELFE